MTHTDIEIAEALIAERRAVVAYLLDRAVQVDDETLFDELIDDLICLRHVECYEAGEYEGLRGRLDALFRPRRV